MFHFGVKRKITGTSFSRATCYLIVMALLHANGASGNVSESLSGFVRASEILFEKSFCRSVILRWSIKINEELFAQIIESKNFISGISGSLTVYHGFTRTVISNSPETEKKIHEDKYFTTSNVRVRKTWITVNSASIMGDNKCKHALYNA